MLELVRYSPPALTSSHDFDGLLLFAFVLKFHFFVSGFAHGFTFFFSSLAFLVIAFLLFSWVRFLSAMHVILDELIKKEIGQDSGLTMPQGLLRVANGQGLQVVQGPGRPRVDGTK